MRERITSYLQRDTVTSLATLLAAIAGFLVLTLACSSAWAGEGGRGVHVGWLLGTPRIAAVAIDTTKVDNNGERTTAAAGDAVPGPLLGESESSHDTRRIASNAHPDPRTRAVDRPAGAGPGGE